MAVNTQELRAREEVEAILASGILARSPNLEKFFRYATEQYFAGRGAQIKEFNIAVEAFGRPPTFDPKADSIVRVEAYRLRKRLEKYYATRGWGRDVRIHFPAGQYAPEFRYGEEAAAAAPGIESPAAVASGGRRYSLPSKAALAAAAGLALAAAIFLKAPASAPTGGPRPAPPPPLAAGTAGAVRILAGSAKGMIDQAGNEWGADRFFGGGKATAIAPVPIRRTRDRALYLSRREGDFTYDIPLAPGVHELRLHFAEPMYGEDQPSGGGEANRLFSIQANGKWLAQALDVVSNAGGGHTADVVVYRDIEPASDGFLHLSFVSLSRDKAFVNAIEVLPGLRGRMLPLRMVAGHRPARDSRGGLWRPEAFSAGGQVLERPDPVSGAEDRDLYRYERFGHFSYVIPVVREGQYTVTLHFAEQFFGTGRPGGGGPGRRVFDLYCNGRTLLQHFDILSVAAPLQAVTKSFTGLKPDAQGKLVLTFVPVRNYPLVNAIEVVDEGR